MKHKTFELPIVLLYPSWPLPMPPQLQWTTSSAASLLHMASIWCQGAEIVDDRIRAILERTIDPIRDRLVTNGDELWRQCFATVTINPASLDWLSPPLVDSFHDLGQAIESLLPKFEEQVASRQRPLCDAWESRGPGIISVLAKRGICAASPEAHVLLVQPIVGGYGRGVLPGQLVMEAMLVNPIPQLPEVVRLAWLVVQATTHQTQLDRVALISAVIGAATEVELVHDDDEAIQLALRHWSLPFLT